MSWSRWWSSGAVVDVNVHVENVAMSFVINASIILFSGTSGCILGVALGRDGEMPGHDLLCRWWIVWVLGYTLYSARTDLCRTVIWYGCQRARGFFPCSHWQIRT